MSAIYKRELKAYFTSPIGYTILIIFYFFSGWFFSDLFEQGVPDLSAVFDSMFIFVLIIAPLLTMRLFSEDKRQKTDQLLLTAPVRLISVVLGKLLAAITVYATAMGIMVVYQMIISSVMPEGASVDWMVFIGYLLGMFLFGFALIALGLFISALTESQVVSAVCTLGLSFGFSLLSTLANQIPESNWFYNTAREALLWLSFSERYAGFTTGVLNYGDIFFFVSIGMIFVVLTIAVLDRKRYA